MENVSGDADELRPEYTREDFGPMARGKIAARMREPSISNFAGLKVRLAATAIDFLIIAGYAALLAIASMLLVRLTSFAQRFDSAITVDILAFVTLILPVILYFSLQEGSSRQATLGKHKMGLKVIDKEGGRLAFSRALLRSALKFLPWQLAHTAVLQIRFGHESYYIITLSILAQAIVIIYILSILLDRQHRAPYDWLAGSRVIRLPA